MAIYYGCPDRDVPTGGVRVIYRHVDILNRNGFPAYVLHRVFPFRCTWFENSTPVAHEVRYPSFNRAIHARVLRRLRRTVGRGPSIKPVRALELDAGDFLVIPEGMPGMADIAPRTPKLVFNQSGFLTLRPYPLDVDVQDMVYAAPDLLGVIVVSEESRRYVETIFPKLRVHRVHYGINPQLFAFAATKKRQLAYMSGKNPQDIHQVLLRLRLTGHLDGWNVVEIADRTEVETAAILRESAVFLSFGSPEGFGLPAAEAMLAGCVVVGYHGYGGREFLTEEHGFPIAAGDIVTFSDTVANILRELETAPAALARRVEAASQFVAENYSPEREERDLLEIWTEFAPTR